LSSLDYEDLIRYYLKIERIFPLCGVPFFPKVALPPSTSYVSG
jgi:hypothetical protein